MGRHRVCAYVAVGVLATWQTARGATTDGGSIIRFSRLAGGIQAQSVAHEVATPVALVAKARGRTDFSSAAEWCWAAQTAMGDGNTYTLLDLPGMAASGTIGSPRMPYHGRFIRVPDGAAVRLVIDEVTWAEIPGAYVVSPMQPAPVDSATAAPPFVKDMAAYASESWYPEAPVRIADRMRVRGREFVYVMYVPVSYHAAGSALRAAERVKWHLEFELPVGGAAAPLADPLGEAEYAAFFDSALDATVPEAFAASAANGPMVLAGGADYLVITADAYLDSVAPLVNLKRQMGLTTRVVALSTIGASPDANAITDYIRNAYQTWSPRPTYLLLVGDAGDLPPHDQTSHPTRPNMPATDLHYLAVDGDDIFPDLFGGRISCSSVEECGTIVNKIVAHQTNPDASTTYRNSALSMGYFQDLSYDTGGPPPQADGIEDRLFMETAEAHKNFLETKGRTVHTAYTANSDFVPRSYNRNSILHPGASPYIGTQSYGTVGEGRTEVMNRLNQGVSFAWYRAHGGWGSWDYLVNGDVNGLVNGTKLPVVLSVTCQTGWFDWPGEDCLCERLMSRSGGGAVAVVGATRNSSSWWNDWFLHGFFESLWPDYMETLVGIPGYRTTLSYGDNTVGRSPRLGQALNFAKQVMYDKYAGGSQDRARKQFEILMLFGDPHMHVEPWNDNGLVASHPALVSAAHAEFSVTVTGPLAVPVAGATVRLTSTAGDDQSAVTDASGRAFFVTEPLAVDFLTLEVTKAGMIPYIGRINLEVQPLTVSHPTSVNAVTGGFAVQVRGAANEPLEGALVTASSAAGDNQQRTTDFSGQAVFAFIPLSITTMEITVSARACATYHGTIQMIPGTLTVQHAAQVDEACGPFTVTVLTGGNPLQAASVLLESTQGSYGVRVTDVNGVVRFPNVPLGPDELTVRTQCRGYTPIDTSALVIPGNFVWDSLPSHIDCGFPEPVRIRLISRLDGSSVITGYVGTATLEAINESLPPPPVSITSVRRYDQHSYIYIQNLGGVESVDLDGWMLVKNGSSEVIDTVDPDIKDLTGSLASLDKNQYRTAPYTTVGAPDYWAAVDGWNAQLPGWVMLLDAASNIVDFVAWGWDAEELAAMVPVIRGRTVPLDRHWRGDGVPIGYQLYYVFRKASNTAQDRNVAEDFLATSNSSLWSPFDSSFLPYGAVLTTAPTSLGPFVGGVWTGGVSVMELGSNVLFRAEHGPRRADSEQFDVIQATHSQYAFDAFVNTQKLWNVPFDVTVRAQNRNGMDYTTFNGTARLYGYADATASPVLITEIGMTEEAFVEIQNVSTTPADVSGWRLVVGDDPADINGFNATTVALPDSMAARSLISFVEGRLRPPNPALPGLAWSPTTPGWAMLLDDDYAIADFVVWGWDESNIETLSIIVNKHRIELGAAWVGPGAPKPFRRMSGSLQRRGSVDYNRGGDFTWWIWSSRGAQNEWLTVPLTRSRRPVAFTPATTGGFVDGVWSGSLTVQEDVDAMYLEARDALGNSGESQRFNVRYLGPITVTVPPLVREGDGTLSGRGRVSVEQAPALSLILSLTSSDATEVTVPGIVTILGKSTSRTFDITVQNDTIMDFTQTVEIRAAAGGYGEGVGAVAVQDDELCDVTLTVPASTHEGAGFLRNTGLVALSRAADEAVEFRLASSVPSLLQVPSSVSIARGDAEAHFSVTLVENATPDGEQSVVVTATQDDVTFKTGTVVVADNDAHHFGFRPIGNVQTAQVPFAVTIEARDEGDRVVTRYSGTPSLSALSGAHAVPIAPSGAAPFVGGVWSGDVNVLEPWSRVELATSDTVAEGRSGAFDVTHGPLAHFAWTPFPTGTVHVGAWLPARVQACDTNGFPVTSFRGPARIEVTQHDHRIPVRLLTFVGYAQIERGYRHARAAIDAHFPHVQETLTTTTDETTLASELSTNDVFLLVAQDNAPAGSLASLGGEWARALSEFVNAGGVVIACSSIGEEHVLLREAGIADLLREDVGGKESPYMTVVTVATNRLTAGVARRFGGAQLAGYSTVECEPIVRSATNSVPVVMHRALGAGHVVMLGNGFAEPNENFGRVLANAVRLGLHRAPRTVSFAPEQSGAFIEGVWTGVVQVTRQGLDTEVVADDQDGHRGGTAWFDVVPLTIKGLSYEPAKGLVFQWESCGVTPYTLSSSPDGPDREYLPLEAGILATPPLNTYSGKLDRVDSLFYRLSVPQR